MSISIAIKGPEHRAPQYLDADVKSRRSLDDSQSTATTVASNDGIDHEDELQVTRSPIAIHEDNIKDEDHHATFDAPQEQTKNPSKRQVNWGSIRVRDYGRILGENPCCSYGPPLTLDWDYEEYEPLDVDTYEFHQPP